MNKQTCGLERMLLHPDTYQQSSVRFLWRVPCNSDCNVRDCLCVNIRRCARGSWAAWEGEGGDITSSQYIRQCAPTVYLLGPRHWVGVIWSTHHQLRLTHFLSHQGRLRPSERCVVVSTHGSRPYGIVSVRTEFGQCCHDYRLSWLWFVVLLFSAFIQYLHAIIHQYSRSPYDRRNNDTVWFRLWGNEFKVFKLLASV